MCHPSAYQRLLFVYWNGAHTDTPGPAIIYSEHTDIYSKQQKQIHIQIPRNKTTCRNTYTESGRRTHRDTLTTGRTAGKQVETYTQTHIQSDIQIGMHPNIRAGSHRSASRSTVRPVCHVPPFCPPPSLVCLVVWCTYRQSSSINCIWRHTDSNAAQKGTHK